jgi:hypothetical protein
VYGFLRLMLRLLQKRVRPLVEREGLDTSDLLKDLLSVRTLVAILTPIS